MEKYTKVKKFDLSDVKNQEAVHLLFGISYQGKDSKKKDKDFRLEGLNTNKVYLYPNNDFPLFIQMEERKIDIKNNKEDYYGRKIKSTDLASNKVGERELKNIRLYRNDLKRDLLKAMGVLTTRKNFEFMEELYVSGDPTERKKGETLISELMNEYDLFCDQLANFILSLVHCLYYEGQTLKDKPTKVLELVYQKSIDLCNPIRTQFEKELIEEYQIVDLAKKVLGEDYKP